MDIFVSIMENLLKVKIEKEYRFCPERKWRFDYAIPEKMLAIEIEGGVWQYGRHNRAGGFLKDMEKYNKAAELGWRILRFTPDQITTTRAINTIRKALEKKEVIC